MPRAGRAFWRSRHPKEAKLGEPGEVCKRSNFTYTLMFSVPNPKLGDAGDIVVTESSEGRQTWHQTRMTAVVMGETLAEGTGPG